jgi:hypothetical protein
MLLKNRYESNELMALRGLNTRMQLTEKEKFHYMNLKKGYEGEVKFDQQTECLSEERYIINDLLLEVNNSYFQIDTLIISQGIIHLLDSKYYQGDCYLEDDNLYSVTTGREYKNPVVQLKRCSTLFRQLLQNLKQNYLVEALVIFNNPEFTLYQTPKDLPIILPTQVNRFLNEINDTPSKLDDGHKKLAQKLISLHQTKNPFVTLPKYNYNQLKKGTYCKICESLPISIKGRYFVCEDCGSVEKVELAILRNVSELKLLFPEQKLTTQIIYDWSKADLSRRTLRRILKKNFTALGSTSNTYYE